MPKPPTAEPVPRIAEWALALFAGRERASVILGDLAEIAATRGRLWFWKAYARTAFSLTWRIVLALFVADVAREFMFNLAGFYFRATPATWRTANGPYLLHSMGPLLACVMSTLWFAVPFSAVRYGVRDRFVRLAFVAALGTMVAFLFIPWASLLAAMAMFAMGFAALGSPRYRSPLLALAGTAAAGLLAFAAASGVRAIFRALAGTALTHGGIAAVVIRYTGIAGFQAALLTTAFAASKLHRKLHRRRETA
jgi:hypothetical protein